MKSLSGSIVITAGFATLVAVAMVRHDDTDLSVMATGGLAVLLGFAFWIRSLSQP